MYTYTCIHMCIYVCKSRYMCKVHVYTYIYIYCMYVYVYMYMYIYIHVSIYSCIYIYTSMSICVYIDVDTILAKCTHEPTRLHKIGGQALLIS